MEIKSIIESPFIRLFVDTVVFAQQANEIGPNECQEPARFARASISSAVLSLECAANCCVAQLPNGGCFRDDVDKLPFLSKFEAYLGLTYSGRKLDRGCTEVQKVQELKSIRDRLVHPKPKTVGLRKVSENLLESDPGVWQQIGINRDEKTWGQEDAIKVIRASTDFLNLYFLELCSLNHNRACKILTDEIVTNPPLAPFETQFNRNDPHLRKAVKEWGTEFKFLGILRGTGSSDDV